MDEGLEGHLQALRSVYKRSSATLTSPPLELPESEIVHVDIHQDPAGKDIVLWADILVAFKGADNVRHKTRVLPFLKDERFHTLEPLRIAAMPKIVLDVYIDTQPAQLEAVPRESPLLTSQPALSTPPLSPPPSQPQLLAHSVPLPPAPTKGNPQYGSEDVVLATLKEFNVPKAQAKPPQTTSNSSIGGYHLHSHSSIIRSSVDSNVQSSADTKTPEASLGDTNTSDSTSPEVDTSETSVDIIAELIAKVERGDLEAQVALGDAYETGVGLSMDYTSAMKYFRKAANQGHVMAQYRVGLLYTHGRGVQRNELEAQEWFRKAAEKELPEAQYMIGWLRRYRYTYMYMYSSDHYPMSMTWFLKASEQGYAKADVDIGYLFKEGLGVPRDYKKAIEWFQKAMEDDPTYHVAPFEMGQMHNQGLGVPLDYSKAAEWFVKAADLGDVNAQRSLGAMYRDGRQGVPQDSAMEWYLKAADHQHTEAYFCIGELYFDGWGGLPRDLAEAKKWFQKATFAGHFEAKEYYRKCGGEDF
ncbi:hypothetical protein BGZ97_008879 [Linnemannia gamsii]|uniref:HCP-like protein n=1 Tax=Linnemannia gamsii TaxID=64522 RepID=A0A9P6RB39_9FUNG|nr:hypothetical protein BGZ97_008879 [Linnemannia gamsii]